MISRKFRREPFLALAATLLCIAFVGPLSAAQHCSNASLLGTYGFLVTGTAADGPVAIMGPITADGNGNISGFETISDNGVIGDSLGVTGTYKISSNCSGTATIAAEGGITAHYNLAVAPGGKVQMVATDSGTVESGFALPQGINSCSSSVFKGTYNIAENGSLVGQGVATFGGQMTLKANGLLSGTRWGSVNGTISSGDTISGAFKIGKTCFGAAVVSINQEPQNYLNLVVVNGGHTLLFVQGDSGTVLSGSLER